MRTGISTGPGTLRRRRWGAGAASCAVLVALLPLTSGSSAAFDIPGIFDSQSPAVVLVAAVGAQNRICRFGSGFVLRPDALIVTNSHVIDDASKIVVTLASGQILSGVVLVYQDRDRDLAVLSADGKNLPVVRLGDSDEVKVGEDVIAIGNPEGLQNTLTKGVISGIRKDSRGRTYLQTTTPMSEGSSGGPLINMRGQVVGVAVSILWDAQNINFAIPINDVKDVLARVKVWTIRSDRGSGPHAVEDRIPELAPPGGSGSRALNWPLGDDSGDFTFRSHLSRIQFRAVEQGRSHRAEAKPNQCRPRE